MPKTSMSTKEFLIKSKKFLTEWTKRMKTMLMQRLSSKDSKRIDFILRSKINWLESKQVNPQNIFNFVENYSLKPETVNELLDRMTIEADYYIEWEDVLDFFTKRGRPLHI